MRNFIFTIFTLFLTQICFAQRYEEEISAYRQNYKEDFIREERSPLKAKDTAFIRFYTINTDFAVWADLVLTPDAPVFDMLTHSGKNQKYRQYATAKFAIGSKAFTLSIYQSLSLMAKEELKDHLFLPFNDLTNYETTFGGGRYLDLSIIEIQNNKIWLDFNKCYNPYCAFKEGYSCPIPPSENRLNVRIEAGEQLFAGKVSE
jgi:uncharacterized protein (DUF1684 family)